MGEPAGEPVAETTEIEVRAESMPVTIYGSTIEHPRQAMELATAHAKVLAEALEQQKLILTIGDRKYVRVEGWTLLGSLLGVAAIETFTKPVPEDWRELGLEKPEGWESRYEARTRTGEVVGAANGRCMRDEESGQRKTRKWAEAGDYAIASMAQTRATSKALRTALGFIVTLAGFNATPAEEIDGMARAAEEPVYAPGEEPASEETVARALKALNVESLGEVAKVYREEVGIESGVTIWRTPHADGEYIQEAKLLEIVETLEGLEADGNAEDPDVIVEGELVEETPLAQQEPAPEPAKPKRSSKAKEPAPA